SRSGVRSRRDPECRPARGGRRGVVQLSRVRIEEQRDSRRESVKQDLLIVGAGPAGAIAGLVAARAGARVRILERAVLRRHTLCGDSVNPGAVAILRRLGVAACAEARGLPVAGMVVSGEGGVTITGRYPHDLLGRSILRRDLDAMLLDAAVAAGCELEAG